MVLPKEPYPRRYFTYPCCPYCMLDLPKTFTRSKKCPHCREHIYVRTVQGKKWYMTNLSSHEMFGYPHIKRENIAGNPRDGICVCHACGDMDSYFWLYGIDHFPLLCRKCHSREVFQWGGKAKG